MKFRRKSDGKILYGIDLARIHYCQSRPNSTFSLNGKCDECPLRSVNNGRDLPCVGFVARFPEQAAELMGYEIVEDDAAETPPETPKNRPRLCDILGVDVGEVFDCEVAIWTYSDVYVDEKGRLCFSNGDTVGHNADAVYNIINTGKAVRRPKFTEEERAHAAALVQTLGAERIYRDEDGRETLFCRYNPYPGDGNPYSIKIKDDAFPSIEPGKSYTVDEILSHKNC